jgi:SAM-dependent methyltransferase
MLARADLTGGGPTGWREVCVPRAMVGFDQWYRTMDGPCRVYERVMQAAYDPCQYVRQQGFSTRDDILALAGATVSGLPSAARLLDICCGPGGPGQLVSQTFGCTLVGLDTSEPALRQSAAARARGSFGVVGDAVRLPFGANSFDGALMLDSLASIADPPELLDQVAQVVRDGGRLGLTAETGPPLTASERADFRHTTLPSVMSTCELVEALSCTGFRLVELRYTTARAETVAERLVLGMRAERAALRDELGHAGVEDLLATLDTLARMLSSRRLEEVAVVAQLVEPRLGSLRCWAAGRPRVADC